MPGCRPSACGETVSGAPDGLDDVLTEFLPEEADADVDDVRTGVERRSPGQREQLSPAQDLTRVPQEGLEHRELPSRELDPAISDRHPSRPEIERHAARSQEIRCGRPAGPAQPGPNTSDELVILERFAHVVVGTGLEAHHNVALGAAGQHEHRQRLPARPQLLQDVEPIALGEAHVEDDQVELLGQAEAESGRAAVDEQGFEARRAQGLLDRCADAQVVFSDQDPGQCRLPPGYLWRR